MKKQNYRYKHISIITLAAALIIIYLIPVGAPEYVSNIVTLLMVVIVNFFNGPHEKADELAEKNLNRANKYTMIAAFFSLFIFHMLDSGDDKNNIVSLPSYIFICTLCGLMAFRSILFIIFDRPLKCTEE